MLSSSKNFKQSNLILIIVLVAILTLWTISSMALGGGKNPLVLEGYQMVDALNEDGLRTTQIELIFSKNVVNMVVSENNKDCFTVIHKNDRAEIPIDVQMADDQIEREKRNIITIIMEKPLEQLKAYQIVISPELESKSGEKLGKELVLEFVTLGEVK